VGAVRTQLKLFYHCAKLAVEEVSMRRNRWIGRGLWELFAILLWVSMLAALVVVFYEFFSSVHGWQPV
jgi:hypothetical protein